MGRVPVKHFNGSLKEAEALALRLNVKNKLPMTQDAKSEAAWRMLVAGLNDPRRDYESDHRLKNQHQAHGASLESPRRQGYAHELGRRAQRAPVAAAGRDGRGGSS